MPKSRLIIIGAGGFIVLIFILLFLGIIPGIRKPDPTKNPVTIKAWGVFDDPEAIATAVKLVPGYIVDYKKMDPLTYETDLINALAAGKGPDVFMIKNTWLPKHSDKLVPVNPLQLGLADFQSLYPTVVSQDFAPDGYIYALPMYIDTLALFYNKDAFDGQGIIYPPKTWSEFQNYIASLRQTDSSGKISKAAAAIGGSEKNIPRASDALSALMLQSGVKMVAPDFSSATFSGEGLQSLNFWTKFADPSNPLYTWNDFLPNAVDAFAKESVTMMLGYGDTARLIKEKNPFLNFGVAPLPQPSGAQKVVNYASYWGLAVSNRVRNPGSAWGFVLSFAANNNAVLEYAKKTGKVPALKNLLAQLTNDPAMGVFARQALTARSWPQIDSGAVDTAFSKMIDDVINGKSSADKAIREAEATITNLMKRKKGQL